MHMTKCIKIISAIRFAKGFINFSNVLLDESIYRPHKSANIIKHYYRESLETYDNFMQDVSHAYDYAPGRLQSDCAAISFFYKGVEVIYIFPWERYHVNSKSYIDTRYAYSFNEFYEYIKFRHVKDQV